MIIKLVEAIDEQPKGGGFFAGPIWFYDGKSIRRINTTPPAIACPVIRQHDR